MKAKAYQICREFLSGSWKTISSEEMIFKAVTGGLSNILFYCSLPSTHTPTKGEPKQVLLRMYGQMHIGGETRTQSAVTDAVIFMLLSERKLGPKLYGIFSGGRLEEYLSARAMTCAELREPIFSKVIARKLANVHSLNVPINKEPSWLFETMNNWLQTIRLTNDKFDKIKQAQQVHAKSLLEFNFEDELLWLSKFLKEAKSPVVFSHNDLQEGNILIPDANICNLTKSKCIENSSNGNSNSNGNANGNGNINNNNNNNNGTCKQNGNSTMNNDVHKNDNSENGDADEEEETHLIKELDERIVLIDFEYCAYNYRGFDLANHFCEWSYDYTKVEYPHFLVNENGFPSEAQRLMFIREYLRCSKFDLKDPLNSEEHLLNEANYFTLASHLLWSIWSALNASTSPIAFGYWEYGKVRLDAYLSWKKQLLMQAS